MKRNVMTDIRQRLIMSAISIVLLIIFIGLAPNDYFKPIFALAVAGVSSLALIEYFQIAKYKGVFPSITISIVGTILYTYAIFFSSQWKSLNALPLIVLGIFLAYLFLSHFSVADNALTSIAVTFFGIFYITVTLSLIIKIVYFFPNDPTMGQLWLIYLLAVTKMTDVGGLFVGRFFGKRKLSVVVSPNKTVEGAVGGVICATLTSVGFAYFGNLNLGIIAAIFLGCILSVFAEMGDLAESLLKRDGGVKDSGNYIPGLGGVLDIVDSLIFTTPVVYLFLRMTMD